MGFRPRLEALDERCNPDTTSLHGTFQNALGSDWLSGLTASNPLLPANPQRVMQYLPGAVHSSIREAQEGPRWEVPAILSALSPESLAAPLRDMLNSVKHGECPPFEQSMTMNAQRSNYLIGGGQLDLQLVLSGQRGPDLDMNGVMTGTYKMVNPPPGMRKGEVDFKIVHKTNQPFWDVDAKYNFEFADMKFEKDWAIVTGELKRNPYTNRDLWKNKIDFSAEDLGTKGAKTTGQANSEIERTDADGFKVLMAAGNMRHEAKLSRGSAVLVLDSAYLGDKDGVPQFRLKSDFSLSLADLRSAGDKLALMVTVNVGTLVVNPGAFATLTYSGGGAFQADDKFDVYVTVDARRGIPTSFAAGGSYNLTQGTNNRHIDLTAGVTGGSGMPTQASVGVFLGDDTFIGRAAITNNGFQLGLYWRY